MWRWLRYCHGENRIRTQGMGSGGVVWEALHESVCEAMWVARLPCHAMSVVQWAYAVMLCQGVVREGKALVALFKPLMWVFLCVAFENCRGERAKRFRRWCLVEVEKKASLRRLLHSFVLVIYQHFSPLFVFPSLPLVCSLPLYRVYLTWIDTPQTEILDGREVPWCCCCCCWPSGGSKALRQPLGLDQAR